jgi:hypothetical protein
MRPPAGKVLRRCDICGKFHASYFIDDPLHGRRKVCYTCWKAVTTQTLTSTPDSPAPATPPSTEPQE